MGENSTVASQLAEMLKNKKGEGLALNIIVVAILVLLVLVVLIVIFSNSIKNFVIGTKDCTSLQGQCQVKNSETSPCGDAKAYVPNGACSEGQVCCKEVIENEEI